MPAFQLYPREGDLATQLMNRAWQAGYHTLFVTVDVAAVGLREGERRMGISMPPSLSPKALLNIAMHPRWAREVLRHKRISGRNFLDSGRLSDAAELLAIQTRHMTQPALSWDDFAWMRDQWKGRIYVKGVLEPGGCGKGGGARRRWRRGVEPWRAAAGIRAVLHRRATRHRRGGGRTGRRCCSTAACAAAPMW